MSKAQRDKGNRFEREIVNLLKTFDLKAQRIPLSGAMGYRDEGADVLLAFGGREWKLECKKRSNGFRRLYEWLKDANGLVLGADRREALVVLRFIDLCEVLHENDAAQKLQAITRQSLQDGIEAARSRP